MADDELDADDVDSVDERGDEHGTLLGVSEGSYSHLLAGAVQHANRPPVAADPTWVPIGPRNVGGRITAVGQHEDNPLVIYAGSAHGGLWVSRDAGDTWAHTGTAQHNFPVGTIAVPPGVGGDVIVGTGSMTARYVAGLGIFRVTVPENPENAVFNQLAGPPPLGSSPGTPGLAGASLRYTRIRLDPDNPKRFWAAAQSGLWRFEPNGGAGFIRDFPVKTNDPKGAPAFATNLQGLAIWPDYCTDLLVARDPREQEQVPEDRVPRRRYLILYVGVSGAGVFRGRFDRKDRTIEWDGVLDVPNDDLYAGGRAFTRVRLASCEDHASVVYAVFSSNPGANLPEHRHASFVFRSDDDGKHWSKRGRIPRAALYTDGATGKDGQADYDLVLEVDPSDPEVVICGEIDLCKSEDGAKTWTSILDWRNYDLGDYAQHADQHIALFDRSDHRRLWVGNDGGLSMARDLRRPAGDAGFWRKRSHAIIAAQFQDVTAHPNPAFSFMCGGGLQDNGSFAGFGGPTWLHVGRADGGAMAFHATAPEYVFLGKQKAVRFGAIEATPVAGFSAGLSNPVLADLPLADPRANIRVPTLTTAGGAGDGPFIGVLAQDPTLPGRVLVGWKASATKAIAYVFAPPPGPPLANPIPAAPGAAGSLPVGVALAGLNSAGGVVAANEYATAVEFGPAIAGPLARIEGWIGTSAGQLLFALNGSAVAGWGLVPALPRLGGVSRLVTRVSVHPTDSWLVAASSVPDVRNLGATALAALASRIAVVITTAGAVGAARFTFQIGTGAVSAPRLTAPSVVLPGTLTTLYFIPGAFVASDTWSVGPDETVRAAATNTSAGGVAATVSTGGRVFLTYDRGRTWVDVTAPAAPLPRPSPDLAALSPGPVGALEWDRTIPAPARLFAGTLGGVYVLPGIPSSTGVTLAAKPATIPLGASIQLRANLALTAGPAIDCTAAADWSSSNVAAITVNATGLVTTAPGGAAGNAATITVRRGTLADTVAITIGGAPVGAPAAPPAFGAPVVPVAWRPFGRSLPLVLVNDLTIVPGTTRLRAATFGRGIWDVNLAGDTPHRLYIRQTVIEDGRTYPRAVPNAPGGGPPTPLMDPRLPQAGATRFAIDFVHAYDIRVDATPHDYFDDVVDGVEFDERIGIDEAVPFEDNYVYVQVLTSGVAVTDTVHVFLFARPSPVAAPHGAAPVAVPALGSVNDIYPPNGPGKPVAPWVRVGNAPTIVRKVGPAQPVVARFTWTPDDTLANQNVALLALCTTPTADDSLPAAPIDAASFGAFITKERRAALRVVHVAARPAASLYVRDGIADDTRIGGYPVAGRSPDIMVVRPDISGTPADAFKDFMARRSTDTVGATGTNVVYVRVHNRRRFETRAQVKVFAIGLDDANAPRSNPATWTALPAGAAFADVTVPPSGVGYARVEFPTAADPNPTGQNKTYLLLALLKSEDDTDPLPNRDRVDSADAFWDLVSRYVDADNAAARAVPWVP